MLKTRGTQLLESPTSGLGVKIDVQLGLLGDLVSELNDALNARDSVEQTIEETVDKISRHFGKLQNQPGLHQRAAQKALAEARNALEQAAQTGHGEAKKALKRLPGTPKVGARR